MKRYILSMLAVTLLCVSACNKLEIEPKGEITDREMAYQNATIRNQILTGIYSLLINEGTWGAMIPIRLEAGTDVALSRTDDTATPENNSHTSQSAMTATTWSVLYQGINAANEFIHYSNLYVPNGENEQEVAEARFLRAYFYFTLVRLFGDVPFRTEPMLDTNKTDIARTSAVDIYDFIVKELSEVQAILPDPQMAVYGHISSTAAQAALADVYLNLGGALMKNRLPADSTVELMHQRAAYWSKLVLDNPAHDITKTGYDTIFLNQVSEKTNVAEQVWELQPKYMIEQGYRCDSRLGKYNGMGTTISGVYGAGGFIYQTASLRKLYAKVSADDVSDVIGTTSKDTRADWNCPWTKIGTGTQHKNPVYEEINKDRKNIYQLFCGKWRTIYANTVSEAANINYSGARLSIYRIADVHLMYAEAVNEGYGNQAEAVEHINKVRRRAHATEITGVPGKDDVFNLIVDERARELCFEGKRRFDLIRWNLYETKLREAYTPYESPYDPQWVRTGTVAVFKNFNPQAHYILPIPQEEISRNALIPQAEQNQGWGGNRAWR